MTIDLALLDEIHYQWSQAWSSLVANPGSSKAITDVALHHVDASQDARASDDFQRRLAEAGLDT